MQIDYDVGDVIVKHIGSHLLAAGTMSKCKALIDFKDGEGVRLFLDGESVRGEDWDGDFFGWDPASWKKLPKASDEFTEQMRNLKPHKQKADA